MDPSPDSTRIASQWGAVAHLAALVGLTGIPSPLGPLFVMLFKGNDDPFVRQQAKEALNFNLSVWIYGFAVGVLLVIAALDSAIVAVIFFSVLLGTLVIVWLILVVVGGVKAGEGQPYRYPLTLQLLR